MVSRDYWCVLEELIEIDPSLYYLFARSYYMLEELPKDKKLEYFEKLDKVVFLFATGRLSKKSTSARLRGLLSAISRSVKEVA